MIRDRRGFLAPSLSVLIVLSCLISATPLEANRSPVVPNDNQQRAGTLRDGTLTLALRAAVGDWQPEGPAGPTLPIEAFGEVGQALAVPAPLIRVVEGTEIAVSIRNELTTPLVIHGLCTRGGSTCPPLEVGPGQTGERRFSSGPAGTYHYWASSLGAPIPFRELGGAFIVDPASGPAEPDRVMVITEWSDLSPQQLRAILSADVPSEKFVALKPRLTFVINGLSWPATERFTYEVGDRVRWRVINLSSQPHPLHLHGFYFAVNSIGDGARDVPSADAASRPVVTHLLPPAGTMTMTWIPERAGNWLFHCHVMHHVSLDRRLSEAPAHAHHADAGSHHASARDASAGMAGMVIGVVVKERSTGNHPVRPAETNPAAAVRQLTLVMRSLSPTAGSAGIGFELREGRAASQGPPAAPGPTIVLRRNEPVEITLLNHLTEETAIHWHGIELDSYYDGVHGWSGVGQRVTPMIPAGGSFVVRFTPPRAGTFIYHTHLHDYQQLSSGLYGPLVVLDEDEAYDSSTDHVVVLGRSGLTSPDASILTDPDSVVINGARHARFTWRSGVRHRLRVINITADDIFTVALSAERPVEWTPVAKDGATLPRAGATPVTARQVIAVGETYDFEYDAPPGRRTLWMEVRTPGGKWQAQAQVIVK